MLSKLFLLAGALQAAFVSANSPDGRTDVTRVGHWLHEHGYGNGTHDQPVRPHGGPAKFNETNPYLGNNVQTRHIKKRDGMGNAILSNRCSYDVWAWSVDQMGSSQAIHIPARSKYSEPFRSPCDGCGVSFKISTTDQLEGGKQTQYEYAITGGQVWYDISFVDCANGENADNCPGHDKGVAMDSPEAACGRINCAGGSYCPEQVYYVDTPVSKLGLPEPVYGCGTAGTGMDLYMKVCSDEPDLKRSIAGRVALTEG